MIFFSHTIFQMFSCAAVDCGVPNIPEDGILQLVGSDNLNTQYKDQIHFSCSSKYYTLEGDGDYDNLVCVAFHLPFTDSLLN